VNEREIESVERIAERRRRVEDRLAAVRAALASEAGRAPQGRGWLIAVVAGAAGLALAMRRRRAARELPAAAHDGD
jgi:hypothetical protein